MKKILCIAVMALVAQLTFAQTVDFPATEYTQNPKANYRLYKTKNTYNFIKLDTRTVQMEMVQWTTSGYPGTYTLSDIKRVDNLEDEIPGRFTLYATTNFYNFVLLDQIDGRTWQIQWSTDPNEMMVVRIY